MATARKTDEVLAAARNDLEAQLKLVREQGAQLAAEELALTHAISSLDGGNPATSSSGATSERAVRSAAPKRERSKRSSRRASSSRRRRSRAAGKSTADRVNELRGLLSDGPKSRTDLAAALKVSPARVQQLLAELGGSVSSRPDPNQRRGKLWSLKAGGNGGGAAKPAGAGSTRSRKAGSPRKAPAPVKAAT